MFKKIFTFVFMKVSVIFIFTFCKTIWDNRINYWHLYLREWLEESIGAIIGYLGYMYVF